MTTHIFIPNIDTQSLSLPLEYRDWLTEWLESVSEEIEQGDVASSVCFQACLCEILLSGGVQRDWLGVLDSYLKNDNDDPVAYSEKFGARLYGYANQWLQSPIHAIYTRYWFETLMGNSGYMLGRCADLIEGFIQPDGWIYNSDTSWTQLRTRMRSELFMSLAMGVEILEETSRLESHRTNLVATLAATPITGFLSAEYFRSVALKRLAGVSQMPVGLSTVVEDCQAGQGYCDFAVKNKVDDYMGTAKRTSRDIALHSPLATVHAVNLSQYMAPEEKAVVEAQATQFANHLESTPFDIPAFQIRDLPTPFGTDISPIEVVCAGWIRQHYASRNNHAN